MKLSQLFSGEVRTDGPVHTSQPSPAQMEQLNRQIRSLVPGQTITGEIVSRNGGEVQIRLSEDMVLNARVDRNLNMEIGRNMTFEVKNNGSALTLSPLFTNVATDTNVLKALDMAGLPVNQTSVSMTEQLMAAGLPVNKNILQQVFREINSFPQGEISDIINLHKLQLPVNEANVNQMAAYRNLTHQLTDGMEAVFGALPEVFDSMLAEGDVFGALNLYREVLGLIQEGAGSPMPLPAEEMLPAQGDEAVPEGTPQNAASDTVSGSGGGQESQAQTLVRTEIPDILGEGGQSAIRSGTMGETVSQVLREAVANEALELLHSMKLPEGEENALREQILSFAGGRLEAGEFIGAMNSLADPARLSQGAAKALARMFSGKNFRELLAGQAKNNWMLRPEEVASRERVEELYGRLERQLKTLSNALEGAGQTNSSAFRATASMSQNVDFLNQINQMYAYVQLPLRLQQGEAHGELYVYTNKKRLTGNDGTVSALLHLDMEYLGPVDVYVAMQNSKVNTKFYLCDEEMIDFMAEHMDILTQRLKKRGYDCSCSMVTRKEGAGETTEGGLEPLLRRERGVVLSQYAFDVRT
ncbi:MAG: flagellar hook-length control protein FliK [Lachnospiraceae bacterium]|nr:flagellar hook-length control protein FliK [Lachnospiraceae bacterium]